MAESKSTSKAAPKVFDVSKPGKSAPSTSGKPIIITNRPVLKDPMVVEQDAAEPKEEKVQPPSASRLKIMPLHITDEDDKKDEKGDDESKKPSAPTITELTARAEAKKAAEEATVKGEAPKPEKEAAKPAEEPAKPEADAEPTKPEPADEKKEPEAPAAEPEKSEAEEPVSEEKPDTEESETESGDPAERDKTKDGTKAADADLAAQKEQERKTELQKLAESHKYYLPINQVEKRRNKRATLLGVVLVLVLGLVWGDIALDAGLIKVSGVKAPTHFFNK